MALSAPLKTALQAKKDAAETARQAAASAGVSTVACMEARKKQDADRVAACNGDSLT